MFVDVTNVTVWVEASAPGYFTATNSATVKIGKRAVTFAGQSETNAYVGSEIEISTVVANGLLPGHTHNVAFSAKGTDVGSYVGTITEKEDVAIVNGTADVTGNYEITVVNGALTITPREVADGETEVNLELPEGGYVGDGTAKEPTVSVLCGERQLVAGVDYDVTYSGNVDPGTATVTVTFKGNYAGTATAHFDIAEPEPVPPAERHRLWYVDAPFDITCLTRYEGYLVDTNANDAVVGTIRVQAGKPNRKTGISRLTVKVKLAGQKETTVRGSTLDGTFRAFARGRTLDIALGHNSLSGSFGSYVVDGSRDMFAAKDADAKRMAAEALARWSGSYVAAWRNGIGAGWNTLSVVVRRRGSVKVSGTLADGTRVTASAWIIVGTRLGGNMQFLVGERECAVAVNWSKKGAAVNCVLWFCSDGSVACEGMPDGTEVLVAPVGDGLAAGAALHVDEHALESEIPGLRRDLSFTGSVPAKLSLKYRKDGTFGGSFKIYVDDRRRVKPVTVRVCGVVLDGKGYGVAYVKKVGNWDVTVE